MEFLVLTFICGFFVFLLVYTFIAFKGIFDIAVRGKRVVRLNENDLKDPKIQELIALGQQVYGTKLARTLEDRRLGLTDEDIAELVEKKKAPHPDLEDAPGIRDLLEEGRDDEAIDIYQKFAGVDEYTARAMVERIKREMEGK